MSYSIVVSYVGYDADGQVNYNEEAVLQMVTAAAPRLKSVRMWRSLPRALLALQNALRTTRPPCQVFFVVEPGESPGLTSLENHTDFSQLHSLEIWKEVRLEALQTLTLMTDDGAFKSLHTLALSTSPFIYQEQPNVDEAASLLLRTLHPLKDLGLTGLVANRTFATVLQRRSESLRKLQFIPARQHQMQIEPCHFLPPHPETSKTVSEFPEVELLISRNKGDEKEVSIYRTLGMLPRLKRTSLLLDCSHIPGFLNNGVPFLDDEQKASHMCEDPINIAVDPSPALGIFRAMSTTNTLQYLKLQVSEARLGRECADGDFSNLLR